MTLPTMMFMAATPSSDQANEPLSSSCGAMIEGLDVQFVTPSGRISTGRKGREGLAPTAMRLTSNTHSTARMSDVGIYSTK